MEEPAIFEALIKGIRKKLDALDSVTAEAIFAEQRKDYYYPRRESSYHSWEEAKRASEYKEVDLNSEENGVHPNHDHPGVKKALNAICEFVLENGVKS